MNHHHLPTTKSFDKGQDTFHLTGEQMPNQSANAKPRVDLSTYQKKLLEVIQQDDRLVKIFQMIFKHYPNMIVTEYRQTHPQATPRQKSKSRETTMNRLKLEAQIEDMIVRLAGIDIENLLKENSTDEQTEEDISEAIEKEHEDIENERQ